MRCSSCTGVFHPATGHQWSEKTRLCLGCARDFFYWMKNHQKRKWGRHRPYDHTETSRNKNMLG
jgi:hypothetical protein